MATKPAVKSVKRPPAKPQAAGGKGRKRKKK